MIRTENKVMEFKVGDDVVFHGKYPFGSNGLDWHLDYKDMIGQKTTIIGFDAEDNTYKTYPQIKDKDNIGIRWVSPEWIELATESKPKKFKIHKFAKETIKQFPKVKFKNNELNWTIVYNTEEKKYKSDYNGIRRVVGARYVNRSDSELACEIINNKMEEMKNANN